MAKGIKGVITLRGVDYAIPKGFTLITDEALVQLQAQAENKQLRVFIEDWDGHEPSCGRNREGFEGCDETMFNCDCGYQKAKEQALKGR